MNSIQVVAVLSLSLALVGCSGDSPPPDLQGKGGGQGEPDSEQLNPQTESAVRAEATQIPETEWLQLLLPDHPSIDRTRVIKAITASNDQRFVAPLIDLIRFIDDPNERLSIVKALTELTGEDVQSFEEPWRDLLLWYGPREDLETPPGYLNWKGELHAQLIDPQFRRFFREGFKTRIRPEEIVWGGVRVDGIPALVNPTMIPADEASFLQDDEPVFGVSINNDDRAYPLRIADWHEMVNDKVGGKNVALAYCTLCGAGILYDTEVNGRTFEFGSSGFLYRSNKLMYDRETDTLWNQFTGKPVLGPLVGEEIRLDVLPVVLTSWSDWKSEHPKTRVADLDTGFQRKYRIGLPYGRYFADPGTMFPVWGQDDPERSKARIFVVSAGGEFKAYPLESIQSEGGIINDQIGSIPVVIAAPNTKRSVGLPERWKESLRSLTGNGRVVQTAADLRAEDVREVISQHPELAEELTEEILLGMPTMERLEVLHEFTPGTREGRRSVPGQLTPSLRNLVAQRGLIGEARAFKRGDRTFRLLDERVGTTLVDEGGLTWRVTEDALVSDRGDQLLRLGSHLAFRFGWDAFYPRGAIYQKIDSEP